MAPRGPPPCRGGDAAGGTAGCWDKVPGAAAVGKAASAKTGPSDGAGLAPRLGIPCDREQAAAGQQQHAAPRLQVEARLRARGGVLVDLADEAGLVQIGHVA